LKIINGNPGGRPLNTNEPKPEAVLPESPDHLDDQAKFFWRQMAERLHRARVLTELDTTALELLCDTYSRRREAMESLKKTGLLLRTAKGNWIQSPLVGIINKSTQIIERLLVEFGMTPSSRTRVSVKTDDGPGRWDYPHGR